MAYRLPGQAHTLPKNFTFPSLSGDPPKTPEHPSTEPQLPPPPRHSSVRFGRSRLFTNFSTPSEAKSNIFSLCASDIPLPSIEFPPQSNSFNYPQPETATSSDGFLQVPVTRHRILKTPPAQIRSISSDSVDTASWGSQNRMKTGQALQRPDSACSGVSDSSTSSIETFTTQPSMGGSCTSPESDVHDPFTHHSSESSKMVLESPVHLNEARAHSLDLPRKLRWTTEMDNHLWNTYQIYLQEPTITPFKMLPGSLPPLGVSHRVAREAKRTWPRAKAIAQRSRPVRTIQSISQALLADGSQSNEPRSGSTTPGKKESPQPLWPRSEAATRKRLKYLCKRKFSIAPHYQRLLQSRSPSPYLDAFSMAPRPPPRFRITHGSSPVSFATRELGVSLAASSLPNTLSQFAAVDNSSGQAMKAEEWFNQPQSQLMQPTTTSSSTPDHMNLVSHLDLNPIPRLGSPFMYRTWGPDNSRRNPRPKTPVDRWDTIHVAGLVLESPSRLDANINNHKRRALSHLDKSPNSNSVQHSVQDLFCGSKVKDGQHRLRLRNSRNIANSFGSTERVEQLFSPPSSARASGNTGFLQHTDSSSNLLRPRAETIRRLGSPFKLDGSHEDADFILRTPRHAPSRSEPFLNSSSPVSVPINGEQTQNTEQSHCNLLPYDPTEPGISDAERIRRQILNLPFSKKVHKAL